eukprot:5098461-Prymnesium_polylepis.1
MPRAPSAVRPPSRPPPLFSGAGLPPMLEPGMPSFDECFGKCYRGLVLEASDSGTGLPATLTSRVTAALETLRREGYFHHD